MLVSDLQQSRCLKSPGITGQVLCLASLFLVTPGHCRVWESSFPYHSTPSPPRAVSDYRTICVGCCSVPTGGTGIFAVFTSQQSSPITWNTVIPGWHLREARNTPPQYSTWKCQVDGGVSGSVSHGCCAPRCQLFHITVG